MHKIKGQGATVDNLFTEGNVAKRIPATVITADWLNAVQQELINAIDAPNFDVTVNNQLQLKIANIIENIEEVRSRIMSRHSVGQLNIRSCNKTALPQVACNEVSADGRILKRDEYPDLWRYAVKSGRILTEVEWTDTKNPQNKMHFSSGDGVSTFRVGNILPKDLVK